MAHSQDELWGCPRNVSSDQRSVHDLGSKKGGMHLHIEHKFSFVDSILYAQGETTRKCNSGMTGKFYFFIPIFAFLIFFDN